MILFKFQIDFGFNFINFCSFIFKICILLKINKIFKIFKFCLIAEIFAGIHLIILILKNKEIEKIRIFRNHNQKHL